MSHGQATRSTFTLLGVIHFMECILHAPLDFVDSS
jgi:hypothetical protein